MRCVIQRCSQLKIVANGTCRAEVQGPGILLLVAWGRNDEVKDETFRKLIHKILQLRIFSDAEGKMNLSVKDVRGYIGIVSNFTLYASTKKGNRPSFTEAAPPDKARQGYDLFCRIFRQEYQNVYDGIFGAYMNIHFTNDGPVTILMDSDGGDEEP